MKPTYHLYGMKITLDGDLEEAARRAHLAQKLMFQTKMLNVNNLDIIQNNLRLDDGTHVYVLSQHGLDSAQIYVPPKPTVQVPGKRRWTEQFIWPAIEAYDGVAWRDNFVGLILCKGGGFDGPYEFISKEQMHEDFPLYDSPDESAGPQPEVRYWTGIPAGQKMVDRRFEDFEPLGISEISMSHTAKPVAEWDQTVAYDGKVVWLEVVHDRTHTGFICPGEPNPLPYQDYEARAYPTYKAVRTEQHTYEEGLSYFLSDDPIPPVQYYEWEGRELSYRIHLRHLNLAAGAYYSETGGGTAHTCWFERNRYVDNLEVTETCYYCSGEDRSDDAKNAVLAAIGPVDDVDAYWNESYDVRKNMWHNQLSALVYGEYYILGDCYYAWTIESVDFWDYYGSVKSADEFAVVYSMVHSKRVQVIDMPNAPYYDNQTSEEKSLCVAVDGEIFELFTDPLGSRLQGGWGTKYFQIGNKSIGLFYFGRNYWSPIDYQYVYVEVNRDTRESEVVVTPFGDDNNYYDSIGERIGAEITDNNGNPVYIHNGGYGTYRLIRETVTYEEDL